MKKLNWGIVLLFITAILGADDAVRCVPGYFLREWDPITLFFDEARGPDEGGPLDLPGELFSLQPNQPGEFRWLDARTLQFAPAERWQPLETYRITSLNDSFTLVSLLSPPAEVSPVSGRTGLDKLEEFRLFFLDALDPEDLAAMIDLEVSSLPGVGSEVTRLGAEDVEVLRLETPAGVEQTEYRIRLRESIGRGKKITLRLSLSEDPSIPGSVAEYSWETLPRFRLTGMGSGSIRYPISTEGSFYTDSQAVDCGTGSQALFLEFSETPAPLRLGEIMDLVEFSPQVEALEYQLRGNRIYLTFQAERETLYRMTLRDTVLLSTEGQSRSDGGESSLAFFYRQLGSYLTWEGGETFAESHGPQEIAMQGRAVEEVDLRIYRIDASDDDFWPFPNQVVSVNEQSLPPLPGEEDFVQTIEQRIRLLGSPDFSEVIDLPIEAGSTESRFGLDIKEYLEELSGSGEPGTYLVGYRALGSSTIRYYTRLTVTDLALSTVEEEDQIHFWVTSLNTGLPLRGVSVLAEARDDEGEWQALFRGITDRNGHYAYLHEEALDQVPERLRLVYGSDVLVLDPDQPPPRFRENHWFRSNSWLGWLTREPRHEEEAPRLHGFLGSERPVYRLEEKAYLHGYVRTCQQGEILGVEDNEGYTLEISGPGRYEWVREITLDSYHQFSVPWEEEDLISGTYRVRLLDEESQTLTDLEIKRESYRIPRFEVNMNAPTRVPLDRGFQVGLTADYYAGGRASGLSVEWTVTRYPYRIVLSGYPGFQFSSYEAFSRGQLYGETEYSRFTGTTDEEGAAEILIDPSQRESLEASRYFIESMVRGADGQTVTGTALVTALPPFAIGLKIDRFLRGGTEINPEILVVDYLEETRAGQELTVRLIQRQWHSTLAETDFTTGEARYLTDIVDQVLEERTVISTEEPLTVPFQVEESGVYLIEVLGRDASGRVQKVTADLFLEGETPAVWEKTHAQVFSTTSDQESYVPGDTAEILIKSPYQDGFVLSAVEGPVETEYTWTPVSGGQAVVEVPIEENMVPRIPVHFLLIRGRIPGTGEGLQGRVDRGKPASMANTTYLTVEPVEHQLQLELDHPAVSLPGKSLDVAISLMDDQGNPVDGQVLLWLVDRAVLSLGEEKSIDALPSFIDSVESGLSLRDTRNLIVGNLPVEELAGGGGGWDERSMMAAMDDLEENLLEQASIRRNFQTVPYYRANIAVQNGQATIKIDLPDNLTDFAVRAMAVSGDDRFGHASGTLSLRLPVIVQSSFPRFLRPGDSTQAGGIARAVDGIGGLCRYQASAEGLIASGGRSITGSLDLLPGIPQPLLFLWAVPGNTGAEEALFQLAVERTEDEAADAFELRLPIRSWEVEHVDVEQAQPAEGESYRQTSRTVALSTDSVLQEVFISRDASFLRLIEGMGSLLIEPTYSLGSALYRLYPRLLHQELLENIEMDFFAVVSDEEVHSVLIQLKDSLDDDGLASEWTGGRSSVSLTALGLETVAAAKRNGFSIPEGLEGRLITGLRRALRTDYARLLSQYRFNERVRAFTALVYSGEFDSAYAYDLARSSLQQDLASQARILDAFHQAGVESFSVLEEIRENLWNHLIFTVEDSEERFREIDWIRGGWGGGIPASRTETLSLMVRALLRTDPEEERIELLIDTLSRWSSDGWENPRDASVVLAALIEAYQRETAATGRYRYRIRSGSGSSTVELNTERMVHVTLENDEPLLIECLSASDDSLPTVMIRRSGRIDELPSVIEQDSSGFLVEREAIRILGVEWSTRSPADSQEPQSHNLDTILEEHIRVTTTEENYHVILEVPLAAGYEVLNPELAISGTEAIPSGRSRTTPTTVSYEDDRVIYCFEHLSAGYHDFYFRVRTAYAGNYQQPPARAFALYQPQQSGRSDGTAVEIAVENTEE